jgi:hypothetical protein
MQYREENVYKLVFRQSGNYVFVLLTTTYPTDQPTPLSNLEQDQIERGGGGKQISRGRKGKG